MDVARLFRPLVLDGIVLAAVVPACTDSTPDSDTTAETDTDTDADTDTDTDSDTDTDTDADSDTDTDADADCPEDCIASEYAIGDEDDWSVCYPGDSTVCCWITGECCDLCCENW